MEVRIINWEKYNPKRAQKSYTWLRLNNDFFVDEKLFKCNAHQKLIWIILLCTASKHNSGDIELDLDFIAHHIMLSPKLIIQALDLFESIGLIEITTPDYTVLHHTTPTYETDETDERTEDAKASSSTTAEAALQTVRGCHPDLILDDESVKFLSFVSHDTQRRWLTLYSVEYISREVVKAINWLENNPQRRPRSARGASSFLTKWLDRGWERYRKQQPVNEKTGAQRAEERMNE